MTRLWDRRVPGLRCKVEPHRMVELTDWAGIEPAPHLARAGWVQADDGPLVTASATRGLLARSLRRVAAHLTRKLQREPGLMR